MRKHQKLAVLFALLLTAVLLLTGCTANALETAKTRKATEAPVAAETAVPVPNGNARPHG